MEAEGTKTSQDYGSYPKSVIELERLWIFEIARLLGLLGSPGSVVSGPEKSPNVVVVVFFSSECLVGMTKPGN